MSKLLEALKNLEKDKSSLDEILFIKNQNNKKKKNKSLIIIAGIIIIFLSLGTISTKNTLTKYRLKKKTTNIIIENKKQIKESNIHNIKEKSKTAKTKNKKTNNTKTTKNIQKIDINKTKEKQDKNRKRQPKIKNKPKETKTFARKQTKNEETKKTIKNNSIFPEKSNFSYLLIAAEEARKKGKYMKALTYYQRYLKNQKKEKPEILNNIGLIYFKLGKIKMAEKFIEKAYQKEKNEIVGKNLLAIYIRTKNKKACQLIEDLEISNKEKLKNFLGCYRSL